MRHNHGYRKLGRTSAHRKALLKNLAVALVEHQKIETTLMKASEGSFNAHRAVFAHLQDKSATNKLVVEIAPKYSERNGGYTRIVRTRLRKGDAAPMAFIELV